MNTQEENMGMGMDTERNQGRSDSNEGRSNSNESSNGSNYSTGGSQQNERDMHACHAGRSTEMGEQSTTQQNDGNNTRR